MGQSGQSERTENPTTVARKSERELIVTRTFDRPARAVFDAWTRPELFKLWWAPKSMGAVLSACEIDARTGGGYARLEKPTLMAEPIPDTTLGRTSTPRNLFRCRNWLQ